MLLSVVVLFTDHDYMLLDRAINSIREHIKFEDYEIIAVDNREENKSQINIKGVKIITQDKNLYTFEGRRFGFYNSSGKFIWNFDADDRMIGDLFEEDIKLDMDFMQMFYSYDKDAERKPLLMHFISRPPNYGPSVWSRLYNRKLLQKIYDRLEKPVIVPKFEDKILFDFVMSYNPKYAYIERPIYEYNVSKSTTDRTLKDKVDKIGKDGYDYPYEVLGMPQIAINLKRRVGYLVCQSLKKNNNLNIQKP